MTNKQKKLQEIHAEIQRLTDEYRAMRCDSLFAKFHDATKRYGKLT